MHPLGGLPPAVSRVLLTLLQGPPLLPVPHQGLPRRQELRGVPSGEGRRSRTWCRVRAAVSSWSRATGCSSVNCVCGKVRVAKHAASSRGAHGSARERTQPLAPSFSIALIFHPTPHERTHPQHPNHNILKNFDWGAQLKKVHESLADAFEVQATAILRGASTQSGAEAGADDENSAALAGQGHNSLAFSGLPRLGPLPKPSASGTKGPDAEASSKEELKTAVADLAALVQYHAVAPTGIQICVPGLRGGGGVVLADPGDGLRGKAWAQLHSASMAPARKRLFERRVAVAAGATRPASKPTLLAAAAHALTAAHALAPQGASFDPRDQLLAKEWAGDHQLGVPLVKARADARADALAMRWAALHYTSAGTASGSVTPLAGARWAARAAKRSLEAASKLSPLDAAAREEWLRRGGRAELEELEKTEKVRERVRESFRGPFCRLSRTTKQKTNNTEPSRTRLS